MKKLVFLIIFSVFLQLRVYAEEPSNWAVKEVNEAIEKGLVPDELQYDYDKNITREEFCKLCTAVMKLWNIDFEYKENTITFSDTNDKDVLNCAELGIVSGIGDNKFAPDNPITRQEAAKMLYNTLNAATNVISESHQSDENVPECCVPHFFEDGGSIISWARNEIMHMYRYGVMLGAQNNRYRPENYYTREQAVTAFLRLYNCNVSMSDNPIPESEYYPLKDTAFCYISDGNAFALHYPYIKEKYTADYIDSASERYTHKEKGYVYPFDREFGSFVIGYNAGQGVNKTIIVDKKGNVRFQDFNNGLFYVSDITGKYAYIVFPPGSEYANINGVYDIETETMLVLGGSGDLGEGNREYTDGNSMGVVNKDNGIIFENEYEPIRTTCYDDTFILKDKDGYYFIAKSDGRTVKKFLFDRSYKFDSAVGANLTFRRNIDIEDFNKGYEYALYCADIEKKYEGFKQIWLEANGEICAQKEDGWYILNSDGSTKFDVKKEGYIFAASIGYGLYVAESDSNLKLFPMFEYERNLRDIIGINGKIIKRNIDTDSLIVDKSGICAYEKDNKILFFDFFGKNTGSFDLNNETYYNEDTEKEENLIEVLDKKFINGLFWIVVKTDTDNLYSKYILPDGRSFTNWEKH